MISFKEVSKIGDYFLLFVDTYWNKEKKRTKNNLIAPSMTHVLIKVEEITLKRT